MRFIKRSKLQTPDPLIYPLAAIFDAALRANRESLHVFVDYAGHVATLNVRVFEGGWTPEGTPTFEWRVGTDGGTSPKQLRHIAEKLEEYARETAELQGRGRSPGRHVLTVFYSD